MLCIASPAASPPRRTCGRQPRRDRAVQGSAAKAARQRALDVRGLGVAGSAGTAGVGIAARDGQRAGATADVHTVVLQPEP